MSEINLQRHMEKMHKPKPNTTPPSAISTTTTVVENTTTINREFVVMMHDMDMSTIQRMLDNTDFNVIGQDMKDGDIRYIMVLPERIYGPRREHIGDNVLAVCDTKDGQEPLYLIDAHKAIMHRLESDLMRLTGGRYKTIQNDEVVCDCAECSATKNDV